jgi:hypothetical protein
MMSVYEKLKQKKAMLFIVLVEEKRNSMIFAALIHTLNIKRKIAQWKMKKIVSRSAKKCKKDPKIIIATKRIKWLVPLVGILILLGADFLPAVLFYFQSHFFITAKANGVDVSFLNAKAAKERLEKT